MIDNTFFLIDAYAQIYRAFYAIRNLSNSKGQATNAVFVMAKFLIRINNEYPTNLGAFLFDVGKPAFRLEIAPTYKANRPAMPDDLKTQVPYIQELITAFGWKIYSQHGYEADDLIAAIANDFQNHPIKIVSSDKDLSQIVSSRITILANAKDNGFETRGINEIREKFGVTPSQIVGFLAMLGDSSDNIPGVPGIGAKTAAALLQQFDSIDAIIENPEIISNEKIKNKIIENLDMIRKNVQLITLKREIPDKTWHSEDDFIKSQPNWSKIKQICDDLELRSVLKEIPDKNQNDDLFSISNDKKMQPKSSLYTPDMFDN
jgi:DNA polymerase-1